MREVRKKSAFFIFIAALFLLIITAECFLIESLAVKTVMIIAGIFAETAAILHFWSIKYAASESYFVIESGIFFKKTKKIPLEKILLKTRYSFGKAVFLTIIRTAGSFEIIFGEL